MNLDSCFEHLENVINASPLLKDWFLRNQDELKYYKILRKNSTKYYENKINNYDVIVLEKMANACFAWIESPETLSISEIKKANYACLSIKGIYEKEKEKLSENARKKYNIYAFDEEKSRKIIEKNVYIKKMN